MEKVYISGKIGNTPKHIWTRKFLNKKIMLEKIYRTVITPNEVAEDVELTLRLPKYEDYLVADLNQISDCTILYMLEDWWKSPGARIERRFAKVLGKKLFMKNSVSLI